MKLEKIDTEKLPEIEKSALESDEVKSLEYKEDTNDNKELMEKITNVEKPSVSFTGGCQFCYGGCGSTSSPYKM